MTREKAGSPAKLGPNRTCAAVAFQDYARERLAFLKGARQDAQRINAYLRACALPVICLEKSSGLDGGGVKYWNVSFADESVRSVPQSLKVEREQNWRENRRLTRLLREAKLKSSQACVEDIRYGGGRKLDKSLMAHLSFCQWIRHHQNLVLTGATGCGKTWLACTFGNAACRQGCRSCMCARHVCSRSCALHTATAVSANG